MSVEESWEWKITDKPIERKLLEASVNGVTKWKKKEILNTMRFPHLLTLMEKGELPKHFPDDPEKIQEDKEQSLEESLTGNDAVEDHEAVDDPEAVFLKEDEVKQEPFDLFILPS